MIFVLSRTHPYVLNMRGAQVALDVPGLAEFLSRL